MHCAWITAYAENDISQYTKGSLATFLRKKRKKKKDELKYTYVYISAFFFWEHGNAKMQACQIQAYVWNKQISLLSLKSAPTWQVLLSTFCVVLLDQEDAVQAHQYVTNLVVIERSDLMLGWELRTPCGWLHGAWVVCLYQTCKGEEVGEITGFSGEGGVWNVSPKYRAFSYEDSSVRKKRFTFSVCPPSHPSLYFYIFRRVNTKGVGNL